MTDDHATVTGAGTERDWGEMAEPGTLRFERLLPGPVERVWAYLTESDKRGRWLAAGPMEPRAGAEFELRFHHAGLSPNKVPTPERFRRYEDGVSTRHRVIRAEPPHLLVISWGGGNGEEPSEVSFELAAVGERVRLVLTHRRLAGLRETVDVAGGWHAHLAILAENLAGRIPPSFWILHEGAEAEYARRFGAR